MARQFASLSTTDHVLFASINLNTTLRSHSFWANVVSFSTTDQRFWDWAWNDLPRCNTNTGFGYTAVWDGTQPEWRVATPPATGQWVHICITYDGSSTSNAPVIYYDGVSQTVTTVTGASGSLPNTAADLIIGNRADNTRGLNGSMFEIGRWNRILTAGEIAALAKGYSPLFFRNGLNQYIPLHGQNSPENDLVGAKTGTVVGTTVVANPKIIYPFFRRQSEDFTAAGASSIKTFLGLAKASVKTVDGVAIASVKTINGLA